MAFSPLRNVSIVGIGQIPIQKRYDRSLRQMGSRAVKLAMQDAGINWVDALFVGNMLADELQGQKHLATLVASEAGLRGVEALQVRAATATGAAALRMAYFAVASGEADRAIALGVEKMSTGPATPILAKALDAEKEVPLGATLISQNALLMKLYMERHQVPEDGFVQFALNAHRNARHNPNALFNKKRVSARDVKNSRMVIPPLRLFDSSPICDGAAAVVLAPSDEARAYTDHPVRILSSSVATDWFRIEDRPDPLQLEAARLSARKAYRSANVHPNDVGFFEVHDAFSIMACLLLEAAGFAAPGEGWRMAAEKKISLKGPLPIATMGGLKARGHPIGATALYQTCEIVLQLTERAGKNQVKNASVALLQSVGGAGSTVLTHIFGM
ncbi:MAG: beta-ketoacyl synthase N-terminal-like domain-containing protein [Anaerolineae bacterium]